MSKFHTIAEIATKCAFTWNKCHQTPRGGYTNQHICTRSKGHKGVHRCDCGCTTKGDK